MRSLRIHLPRLPTASLVITPPTTARGSGQGPADPELSPAGHLDCQGIPVQGVFKHICPFRTPPLAQVLWDQTMEHRIPAGVSQKDAAGVRPAGLDVCACWSWKVQGTPPSTVPCKRRSSVNGERARHSYAADSASGHSYSTIKGGLSSLSERMWRKSSRSDALQTDARAPER